MDIYEIQKMFVKFRDDREWQKYHTPKNQAISMGLESAEVLEHFQWKTDAEVKEYLANPENRKAVGKELADVLSYILIMSGDIGIDIVQAAQEKNQNNIDKYPVEKIKGNYRKYTEL
jgi:NTP pyrophosphatase (non-canonical NTP hydrolase)